MTDLPEQGRGEGGPKGGSGEIGSQEQPKAERPAKKRLLTPSRIVLFVLVIVAAAVFVVEFRAQREFNRTIEDVSRAWETSEQMGTGMYRADLVELMHGSPDSQRDEAARSETFTWKGIREHRLRVEYGSGDFVNSFRTLRRGE